ncbi:MAG: alpha/beta hydrolase [Gammaproteobacteria bacterium]|nr:alpha/beta hydrolase [Gammaproteobacteria bacterium]
MDAPVIRAPRATEHLIDGPAGSLEVREEVPAEDAGESVAIVCHPHPLYQGTMDNKVVHTLARACTQLGVPAVRFNFRGVGRSEGVYAEGEGELADALAVIDWAGGRWPDRALWVLGFSFGGVIAARAAMARQAAKLVTIAPAVTRLNLELEDAVPAAWLIVQGEEDDVVPTDEVMGWLNAAPPGPLFVGVPGAGHFFHGQLNELREHVTEFLAADPDAAVADGDSPSTGGLTA